MDSTEDLYHNEKAHCPPLNLMSLLKSLFQLCSFFHFRYSPFRVDMTLTFNGWLRYHLNVSLIGLNLNCQQAVSGEDLLVFSDSGDQSHGSKKKACSLYDVTVEGTLELCHFICECFLSQSCIMQFVFLTTNDKILCDVYIPEEHFFKEIV